MQQPRCRESSLGVVSWVYSLREEEEDGGDDIRGSGQGAQLSKGEDKEVRLSGSGEETDLL